MNILYFNYSINQVLKETTIEEKTVRAELANRPYVEDGEGYVESVDRWPGICTTHAWSSREATNPSRMAKQIRFNKPRVSAYPDQCCQLVKTAKKLRKTHRYLPLNLAY